MAQVTRNPARNPAPYAAQPARSPTPRRHGLTESTPTARRPGA